MRIKPQDNFFTPLFLLSDDWEKLFFYAIIYLLPNYGDSYDEDLIMKYCDWKDEVVGRWLINLDVLNFQYGTGKGDC